MKEKHSDGSVIAPWPGDWPGRQVVDLDNVGDPGAWIDQRVPTPEEVLCGDSNDREAATELADAYIAAAHEQYFPLPSEFGMSAEEMRKVVTEEFLGFIREWRVRTVAAREVARNRSPGQDSP